MCEKRDDQGSGKLCFDPVIQRKFDETKNLLFRKKYKIYKPPFFLQKSLLEKNHYQKMSIRKIINRVPKMVDFEIGGVLFRTQEKNLQRAPKSLLVQYKIKFFFILFLTKIMFKFLFFRILKIILNNKFQILLTTKNHFPI